MLGLGGRTAVPLRAKILTPPLPPNHEILKSRLPSESVWWGRGFHTHKSTAVYQSGGGARISGFHAEVEW